MNIERYATHFNIEASDGAMCPVYEPHVRQEPKVVVSSPLGFAGMVIMFEEVPFPSSLEGMVSYVGHPATRALLEALGATTDASGVNGAPGRWNGPQVDESYIAVPLAQNQRPGGVTAEQAVSDTKELKAILCTRIA